MSVGVGLGRGGLVGRDGEVARLGGLVRAVAGGRGAQVWVEGASGIGKSALLAAGLADAGGLGCQVFWAAADEVGQRMPLQVLLDCLRVVPGSADPARREILELLQAAGGGAVGAAADPLPAVTDRLLALVDRLCAEAPVVLVVDDLHWADADSLVVWRQLSRVVPQLPLLLVAACRPVPRPTELVTLQRTAAAAGAVVLELTRLPAEPTAVLVGGLLDARVVGPGLRAAVERAAGNPLYVREMVDALVRERRLRRDGGTAELADSGGGVPVSLAAAISSRLGFVSEPTLEMLRAAALLGAEFAVTDLAAVAGRLPRELSAVVEEAMAAGVLVESGLRLAFRHALIRQVLYDGTPPALRSGLHGRAARALADAGAAVERAAEQLLAALPGTDAAGVVEDWVLDWLAGPGRVLAQRSPQVAAELLSRAERQAAPADPRRERLQAILVSVLVMLGRREEAAGLAERVRAATRDPARAAEMAFMLAWALTHLLRYQQASAVVADALREPDRGVWTVRLRALRTVVAAQGGGDDQLAAAREDLAEAERAGDRYAAALASQGIGISLYYRGDIGGALQLMDRTLAMLGDNLHTADLRVLMLENRMFALEALDRLAEADVAVSELVAVAERYAAPYRLANVRCSAALVRYEAGRWDDALAELEAVGDIAVPVSPLNRLVLHGVSALIAAHRADDVTADTHLSAATDQPVPTRAGADNAQQLVMARAVLAERRGHPRQALAVLASMLDPTHAEGQSERRLWLPDLTRLAMAVGDAATARAAAASAAADAGGEAAPRRYAAAGHCRGLLDGDPARLLAAADTYRAVGRCLELAKALEDAAVVLADRGDLPAARAAYTEAVEQYTALRADWDLLRADNRLRPYGIRRGQRRRPATGWDALTPTELQVAYLVAEGNSNAEIAARRFLSRRTAEVHVSRILTKLEARSRVEIARQAAAHPPAGRAAAAAPDRRTEPGASTG